MGHVAVGIRLGAGPPLPKVADGAPELLFRMIRHDIARVGGQGLRRVLHFRVLNADVTGHTTVDATQIRQVQLLLLNAKALSRSLFTFGGCPSEQLISVIALVAVPVCPEILVVGGIGQQSESQQTAKQQHTRHRLVKCILHSR